jgi:AcrR family transcriptional regulator
MGKGRAVSPVVTREQIIEAADRLAREDGFDKVTVRRLSASLSVTAPALYWHLANKNEIVSQLIDRVAGRVQRPGPEEGAWLSRILTFYGSIRDVFGEYPGIGVALVTCEPTEAMLENCVYTVQLLIDAGFEQSAAIEVFHSLSTLAMGHLITIDSARHQRRTADDPAYAPNAARLAALLGDRPQLAGFQRSLLELDDATSRVRFLQGVELLIRGASASAGVNVPTAEGQTSRAPRGVRAIRRTSARSA